MMLRMTSISILVIVLHQRKRTLGLTIHGLALDNVMAIILGEKEFEVRLRITDTANLVVFRDEVSVKISLNLLSMSRYLPKLLQVCWKDWVCGKTSWKATEHDSSCSSPSTEGECGYGEKRVASLLYSTRAVRPCGEAGLLKKLFAS
jgi:hypothetical protein